MESANGGQCGRWVLHGNYCNLVSQDLDLLFKARHGVAQHPLESGIGSFGAVFAGSSRCASGS